MSGAGSGRTIAGFGQLSPVPPLMDGNFSSSNLSLVPPLDELIEMVQYIMEDSKFLCRLMIAKPAWCNLKTPCTFSNK